MLCWPWTSAEYKKQETISKRGTYQRCTPRLSTWAVARKSPVGEKVTLVAIELVRNASTSRPVGISNVRIVESSDVAINHLESGENVWE